MKISNDAVQQVINPVPKTENTPQPKPKAEEVTVDEATKNNSANGNVGKNINIFV